MSFACLGGPGRPWSGRVRAEAGIGHPQLFPGHPAGDPAALPGLPPTGHQAGAPRPYPVSDPSPGRAQRSGPGPRGSGEESGDRHDGGQAPAADASGRSTARPGDHRQVPRLGEGGRHRRHAHPTRQGFAEGASGVHLASRDYGPGLLAGRFPAGRFGVSGGPAAPPGRDGSGGPPGGTFRSHPVAGLYPGWEDSGGGGWDAGPFRGAAVLGGCLPQAETLGHRLSGHPVRGFPFARRISSRLRVLGQHRPDP